MRAALLAIGALLVSALAHAGLPETAAAHAPAFAEHDQQCAGKDGWSDPAPPVRIFGNVYDVGTCGITVLLVVGDAGAIVIDGATAEAVPSIVSNIERLGLKPSDVKLLLSTHEHRDHAAGLHDLQRRTGATMVATADEKAALEAGVSAIDDPQRADGKPHYRGVRVGRTVRDGEVVRLGALALTAHATPAHAPGSTSWSWRACEGAICHAIVYADSVSTISTDAYRFADHPAHVATVRAALAKIAAFPCDLIVTPHPEASDLYDRLAGKAPLTDPGACRAYAEAGKAKLDERLASEAARHP